MEFIFILGLYFDLLQTNASVAGVLSQEMDPVLSSLLPPDANYTSYIAGSYVQWVEAGGARVVPVLIGRERGYYQQVGNCIQMTPGMPVSAVQRSQWSSLARRFRPPSRTRWLC